MLENTKFFTVDTWKTEIQKAQESKIDAFALNFNYNAEGNNARLSLAFQAANALGFKLFFSFDYAGLGLWPKESVIALLLEYGPNGAYFKRPDGKPLASTFEGWERAEDWPEIKLKTNAFFIPDWSSRGAKVAMTLPGPDGLFSWAAWPEAPNNMSIEVDSSYTYFLKGKPYMMPVSPWFYTNLPGYCKNWLWPSDSLWWERWQQIWWKQPEYVQIISWNDYGESHYIGGLYTNELHAFKPETGRPPFDYVTGMAHDGWRELLPFAIETYKNNISTVTEERLVAWWRPNPNTQCPNAGTTANTNSQLQQPLNPVVFQPNAIYWSMVAKSKPDIRVTVGGVSVPSVVIGEPVGGVGIWHGRAMYTSATGNVIVTAYRNNVIIPGLLMQGDKPISSSCSSVNWNAVVKSQRAPAGAAVTPPYRLEQQYCIAGKGEGNLDGICQASCAKGYCPPEVCTCTKKSGVPVTVKRTVPTVYGCPWPQYTASYLGLCSFLCGTGSCLQQYCIPSSTEKQCSVSADPPPPTPPAPPASTCTPVGTSCNQGTGEGNLQGLCVFSCERGFCPEKACKCTQRGKSLDAPVLSKVVGCPIDSMPTDSWKEYIDLCQFTCERNYCPPGACKSWRNGTTDGISTINCKPANVPGPAFNTRSFQEMDARVKAYGFEDHVLAAVVHTPMWVFARAEDGRVSSE
ncbi:glycosyl hydrolase family 71-domain-containing protein [Paraphoma chrysanthemicola]|uniref:Glycosyl hydrolase family 71-domain-containing protein n=1 Tax=Paraphoma chrysanthemicola TaxID=798071 RepID=A0A8K0QWI9_9PLEO|nr:glycosyl hydrolase family 71-domain-containing protein [Paraphoma chrysanthemicola]